MTLTTFLTYSAIAIVDSFVVLVFWGAFLGVTKKYSLALMDEYFDRKRDLYSYLVGKVVIKGIDKVEKVDDPFDVSNGNKVN